MQISARLRSQVLGLIVGLGLAAAAQAQPAPAASGQAGAAIAPVAVTASGTLCFTPGGPCDRLLESEIDKAQSQILVQAFNFTEKRIYRALVKAKKRGVDVKVILSPKHERGPSKTLVALLDGGVPLLIDDQVKTAHNKVMIFDRREVATGSYNFTNSAQKHNAENLLILRGDALASAYIANWERRAKASRPPHGTAAANDNRAAAANDNKPGKAAADDDDDNDDE